MPCAAQLLLPIGTDTLRQAEEKLSECPELSRKGGSTRRSYRRLGDQRKPVPILLQGGAQVPLILRVLPLVYIKVALHEVPSAHKIREFIDSHDLPDFGLPLVDAVDV